jgi:deoxyribodipyrimidine photo-lyase
VVQAHHESSGVKGNCSLKQKEIQRTTFFNPDLEVTANDSVIFWFRRDLRLQDNAALYCALKEHKEVLAVFIFDTIILDALEDSKVRRVRFIYESISLLKKQLEELQSSLLILHGNPVDIFRAIKPKAVYANHDYEPYSTQRDHAVEKILKEKNIAFKTSKDHVIFERDEVTKPDGKPYTIFTPFSRKWKERLNSFYVKSYPTHKYFKNFKKVKPLTLPVTSELHFEPAETIFPERIVRTAIVEKYDKQRDYPAIQGTTRLSVHLRFGTVSIRKVVQFAIRKNKAFLNELIWRDFFHMILWHFPHVQNNSFKSAYDRIAWRNDPKEFDAWCKGETGYPIVDAGMRELNSTGFMHNRVRMIVASFLTKHLLIDWRWGEAYFAKKLLDYDLAANNGGWQWAASSGCDALPYFRIFNPNLQAKKYDNGNVYIKKWVPEFESEDYPKPIVDHAIARARAIKVYKSVLQ